MSSEENRLEVIERLVEYVSNKLPQDEAPLVKRFVRQYYLSVSPEDLAVRSILDLYGAVVSHWHYINKRLPGEAKVRVFNPHLERDGWQSTHTIIEIAFEDMAFIVDSVSIALNRLNLNIHLVIHIGNMKLSRDSTGKIVKIFEENEAAENVKGEVAIYIEVDRQSDPEILQNITKEIQQVLNDVQTVVKDWSKMRENAKRILANDLEVLQTKVPNEYLAEEIAFIRWTIEDHFTFLGYQEYHIEKENEKIQCELINGSELGLSRISKYRDDLCKIVDLPLAVQQLFLVNKRILVGKTNVRSTVHRPTYTDFILIKTFDTNGHLIKVKRFIGLYTAAAYNSSPKQIPLLREKVNHILINSCFSPKSHDERALLNILETLPRDDLIQATEAELLELSTGILYLQERKRIRLFIRKDLFSYFFSCLVFVPRERFTSALSDRMRDILLRGLEGIEVEFSTRFSESSLARIHFVVRVDPKNQVNYDTKALEQKLIQTSRTWQDYLKDVLVEHWGEERGNEYIRRFRSAFPASYRESFAARIAVIDIDYFDTLSGEKTLAMSLYRTLEDSEEVIRFKLFKKGNTIPLSDVVPILENMGLKIISERPYEISPKGSQESFWINEYRMIYLKEKTIDTEKIKEIFQDAFDRIWGGFSENDGFNRLVLGAKLTWREVMILRAYAKYLWQTGFTFSQDHVEEALTSNAEIALLLVELFKMRFNPDAPSSESDQFLQQQKIENSLELVENLNEDRILRRYLHTILATIRTNYYQLNEKNSSKKYFSFKLFSSKVPELPLPVPLYEIFVYSPRVEAIHLRAAKVARGGIRWSDRREDFRTEVLSLMKTQQVKNAVIVPLGAKGGFVVKKMPEGNREEIMTEVIECYKIFICGLLDLTDNYKGNEIIYPPRTIRYDEDDPYLVVAADKGTATFSDIANLISKEYGFWLGDAFASGGKTGYDHKKMGITAKGAWESVKRHFQELSHDIQTTNFTVIGIGDMAGDVFGNGMLLTPHIKLIAAFNHQHIFLDPNPDPEKSFFERERLFKLARSTWQDYNPTLISAGGGVYSRQAKSIELSKEVQKALDFRQEKVLPNELIRAILKAPVDLFWNGGIGTYVKATAETNSMVGDRTNDALRVNGAELRCKVVGEGGNLGFTQLGRIEYAKLGGRLNTDAIDNSGGVNCSDNEVNIKILLNNAVDLGDLTEHKRNELLANVQEEVGELVLKNNRLQTKAISVAAFQAVDNLGMHGRLIREMERIGRLDRMLEYLPDKEEIINRKMAKQGLTRPEIAVLMAYSKTLLKEDILSSNLPEDPYFQKELERAFPVPLQREFKSYMSNHRLKREIIATQMSNAVVNEMGINFISRLQDETGAEPQDIVRAYTVSREVYQAQNFYDAIDALNTSVDATVQHNMMQELNRLVRRGARWFLRNRREELDILANIQSFQAKVSELRQHLSVFLSGYDAEIESIHHYLISANVPKELANQIGMMSAMYSALDIVEAATLHEFSVEKVVGIYFAIGRRLELGWFRDLIKKQAVSNHWEALARAIFRDDLDKLQRGLTISIMHHNGHSLNDPNGIIDKWFHHHHGLVKRWEYFISELKTPAEIGFTMFAVALRELLDLSQVSNIK